jgi:spore germination protein GerM
MRLITPTILVVVGWIAVASCGFPEQDSAEAIPNERIPAALREPDDSTTTTVAATDFVAVWFVREGALQRRLHPIDGAPTAASALAELALGPDERDIGTTLRTAIVDGVVAGVERVGGRADVELSAGFRDVDPDDQLLAVGQIVMTLTDVAGVGEVTFEIDGAEIAVPLPDGETTDLPVTRAQFDALVRDPGS